MRTPFFGCLKLLPPGVRVIKALGNGIICNNVEREEFFRDDKFNLSSPGVQVRNGDR